MCLWKVAAESLSHIHTFTATALKHIPQDPQSSGAEEKLHHTHHSQVAYVHQPPLFPFSSYLPSMSFCLSGHFFCPWEWRLSSWILFPLPKGTGFVFRLGPLWRRPRSCPSLVWYRPQGDEANKTCHFPCPIDWGQSSVSRTSQPSFLSVTMAGPLVNSTSLSCP